jgi:uncharacterized membrane-anchored protein
MSDNLDQSMEIEQRPVPQRNFWLALVAQLLIIAAIPAPAIYTTMTGTTVFLQTAPVDPYDLLRGYYQTLGYDISSRELLGKLPGGEIIQQQKTVSREIFVTVEVPQGSRRQAAKPIAVAGQQPTNLPRNQIAIRGILSGWQIRYDIEKFYMPETEQKSINNKISNTRDRRNLLVETKVNSSGHAVPVQLWIGNQGYSF